MSSLEISSNYKKHTSGNPIQRRLIDQFHKTAASMIADLPATQVLDAGCGEGFGMRSILSSYAHVIGMDYELEALQLAQQINPTRVFCVGDLLSTPFRTDTFGLTICLEVLEHIERPERALAELCRVSSRWMLLSVPHEPLFRGANFLRGKNMRAWGNDPGHVNHWSAQSFARFVGQQCQIIKRCQSFPWTLVLCQTRS